MEAQYLAWTEDLESLALSVETESNLAGFELALAMELRLELEPLRVWMSLDLGPELGALMAAAGEESEEEAPEDLRIQILVSPRGSLSTAAGRRRLGCGPHRMRMSALCWRRRVWKIRKMWRSCSAAASPSSAPT